MSHRPETDIRRAEPPLHTPGASPEEQSRVNHLLAHERAVLERMVRRERLDDVLEALVRGHEELFPGTLGSVLLLDEEGRRLRRGAAPSLPESYSAAIDGFEIGPMQGSCGAAAFTRQRVVVTDISTDPRWETARELALGHSLRACWSTPILSGAGQVLGTLALYYREPRAPTAHELAAVESSAHIAALAIDRDRYEVALRGYTERLALATRSARMGVFDLDVVGGRLEWDDQMLSIYGVRRADFGGKYESWRERVHPEDLEAAEGKVVEAIEGDRPFETSFRITRPDGEVRFIEARTLIQRDSTGRATRIIGVNIDVTDKKQLEAQLLRSQRLESLGRIAGGIAHDLNNMLAPMLVGPAMLRELVTDPEGLGVLDAIESSARRAASVIRQLLTFGRGTETPQVPLGVCATDRQPPRMLGGVRLNPSFSGSG
jgi:PAS domain S-box-containing protein